MPVRANIRVSRTHSEDVTREKDKGKKIHELSTG